MWIQCDKPISGVVHGLKCTTKTKYRHILRSLKSKRNKYIKQSICQRVLRNNNNVSPFDIRFLLFMYTNQPIRVQWKDCLSENFSIGNRVRQGAVLPPLLFTLYIDNFMLLIRLQDLGLGCHVGPIFAGSSEYADDVALVAPTLYAMDKMIKVCEIFTDKIWIII